MAQRYADYLDREAHHAATPVKAEAIRQAANKLRELERENAALAARLAELERQEPVAWDCGGDLTKNKGYAEWFRRTGHQPQEPLYARPVPAAPVIPPDMILMPREPDETLVAGFVGCETRDEAKLGWAVAVRMQDVRTGTAAPIAPAPVCDCGDTITDSNAGCCIDCMNQIRADAERWRMVIIVNTEVMIPPEIRAHHAEVCAYLAAMKNGKNIQAAIDAAIACQHDKNTPARAGEE